MITAVCLNPSFDKTVEVDAMTAGTLNRVHSVLMDPGGKGANLAAVLTCLGAQAQCVGLLGEDNARSYEALLNSRGVPNGFMHIPGAVRTNTKIVSRDGTPVTELDEPGPEVAAETITALMKLMRGRYGLGILALTGSLPPGAPADTYASLMRGLRTPSVVDCRGPALLEALTEHPLLVKPNREELEEAVRTRLNSLEAVIAAGRTLLDRGAKKALVSMGADGAVLLTRERTLFAPALKVTVSSTVGAGDAMLAGFLMERDAGASDEEAMRSAVAAGAASVMTDGTGQVRREDFDRLRPRVELREI